MEEEKKGKSKLFLVIVLALLGYASWYFFTQFDKKHLSELIPFMDEQMIETVVIETEEKKKGIPNWVYAVLALVIIGVAVPFLLPSEEEEPVKNTKEDKSKIAEKGDFGNKSSEQNMAEQNMANQDVVNPSAPEDSTLVNIPSPKEVVSM